MQKRPCTATPLRSAETALSKALCACLGLAKVNNASRIYHLLIAGLKFIEINSIRVVVLENDHMAPISCGGVW